MNAARTYIVGKRLLQAIVAVAALTPVAVGLAGVLSGPGFLHVKPPWPVDLDSHFRFYSGLFLILGIAWYTCIPAIQSKGERFRLLAALTFAGGVGRLISLIAAGQPSAGHIAGLFMELVVVPLLVLWQRRVARQSGN